MGLTLIRVRPHLDFVYWFSILATLKKWPEYFPNFQRFVMNYWQKVFPHGGAKLPFRAKNFRQLSPHNPNGPYGPFAGLLAGFFRLFRFRFDFLDFFLSLS